MMNRDEKLYETLYGNMIYRKAGDFIANRLIKTNVTPNQVTIVGFVSGLIAAFFYGIGYYPWLIAGMVLANLFLLSDFVDGEIARRKSMCSYYGSWLDGMVGKMVDPVLFFGICWGHYRITGEMLIWIVGFVAVTSRLLIANFGANTTVYIPNGVDLMRKEPTRNKFRRLFAFGHTHLYILLTITSLLNKMWLFMIIVSIYGTVFYIALFIFFNMKIRQGWSTFVKRDES